MAWNASRLLVLAHELQDIADIPNFTAGINLFLTKVRAFPSHAMNNVLC